MRGGTINTGRRPLWFTVVGLYPENWQKFCDHVLAISAEQAEELVRGRIEDDLLVVAVFEGKLTAGKCQLCSFTFRKRDGEPYFELHHVDPKLGHHPHNLLLLCANCHAQFEHAEVTDFVRSENWLISVTINGKRLCVRQPLATNSSRRTLVGIGLLLIAEQILNLLLGRRQNC